MSILTLVLSLATLAWAVGPVVCSLVVAARVLRHRPAGEYADGDSQADGHRGAMYHLAHHSQPQCYTVSVKSPGGGNCAFTDERLGRGQQLPR